VLAEIKGFKKRGLLFGTHGMVIIGRLLKLNITQENLHFVNKVLSKSRQYETKSRI